MNLDSFIAAFVVGLLGAGHCFGMCGGISAALAFAVDNVRLKKWIIASYNLGRISSYTFVGAVLGLFGEGLSSGMVAKGMQFPWLRILAALLLVLMGFYITGWWKALILLERAGQGLWRFIQPLGNTLMPVKSLPQAYLLGLLWGWLPCGLVYSALAFSATEASPIDSALTMLAFGLGTFPAVFLGGLASQQLKRLLQSRPLQIVSGVTLIVFGVWTAYMPLQHYWGGHSHHLHPDMQEVESHDELPSQPHHHH